MLQLPEWLGISERSNILHTLPDDGSSMLPKHWKDTSQLASVCETFDMTENVRDVQLLTVNYQLPLALH